MRRLLFKVRDQVVRSVAVPGMVLMIGIGAAIAQSGDVRAQDQGRPPANAAAAAAEAAREGQRRADEFAEAAQVLNNPAGNPECVWLGRRFVRLMWLDDLDTAFRHLDLYDRFGCPGGHVQASFRCLTKFGGAIDSKVPESLSRQVHACWINPNAQPQPAAAAPAAQPAAPAGGSPPAAAAPAPPAGAAK
ncbi:MAG: beta-1-3, beta-1-6-glucan biosynthesis protein [Pseudomonadota bacterium]|jgi:hypothetical protein